MNFYLLTDIHYCSKKIWLGGVHNAPRQIGQTQRYYSEEVIKEAFRIIEADSETDTVIFAGDMTNNGELCSHEELIPLLRELKKHKKVYVLTATHDYQWRPKDLLSYGFDEHGKRVHCVETARRDDTFKDMYYEFGPEEALVYHRDSLSYVVQLEENVRLFMLNDDADPNRKNLRCGFSDETFNWISAQLETAIKDGQKVIACTHHPIIAPNPIYELIGKSDMFSKERGLPQLTKLTEGGIKAFFTGHSHMQDVGYLAAEKKGAYCIGTACLTGFPPVMRKVDYNPETDDMRLTTLSVDYPTGVDLQGATFTEYAKDNFLGYLQRFADAAADRPKLFAQMGADVSMEPKKLYKKRFFIRPAAKWLHSLTFGKVGNWTKAETGLKKEDYAHIKDEKVVPFILHLAQTMYAGDANIAPDSTEYKIAIGLLAILDSIIRTLHLPLKKWLGYPSLQAFLRPLLYDDGLPDNDVSINLSKAPSTPTPIEDLRSKKGVPIVIITLLTLLITLPITLPIALVLFLLSL